MEIREAKEEDFTQIVKMKDWGDEEFCLKRTKETKEGKASYLVVEDKGKIIGHIFLKYYGTKTAPDYPNMEDVFVISEFRCQGIGTRLIQECEKLAKEEGFNEIGLGVNPTLNPKAKALYDRLGYKDTGRPPYLDAIYNGTEDWVIDMVKDLTE